MRLVSCNETLANETRKNYPQYFKSTQVVNKNAFESVNWLNSLKFIDDTQIDNLAYLRDLLLTINMPIFLLGGTLLGKLDWTSFMTEMKHQNLHIGWYRECGIIPFTTDIDVSAQIIDYNPSIENLLRNDTRLKIYWRLGKVLVWCFIIKSYTKIPARRFSGIQYVCG